MVPFLGKVLVVQGRGTEACAGRCRVPPMRTMRVQVTQERRVAVAATVGKHNSTCKASLHGSMPQIARQTVLAALPIGPFLPLYQKPWP